MLFGHILGCVGLSVFPSVFSRLGVPRVWSLRELSRFLVKITFPAVLVLGPPVVEGLGASRDQGLPTHLLLCQLGRTHPPRTRLGLYFVREVLSSYRPLRRMEGSYQVAVYLASPCTLWQKPVHS